MPQIVPALPQVKAMTADKPVPEQKRIEQAAAATVNGYQEMGGLTGRILLAMLAVLVVSRRTLLRSFNGRGW